MTVYRTDQHVTIHHGDCLEVLATIPDATVAAIITDPPYGLGFMGKAWDDLPPGLDWAAECLRVLKPGGHLLAFGGTRTWHRLAVAVEDAGFEVRDSIAWLYGSGFPKSLDVSKAIDKLDASAERRARALEFTAWFRSTGITRQKAAEVSGMASVTNHYFEVTAQPSVATMDIFDKLRPYLPEVPARIEELVRQRTVESENFKARAVVGTKMVTGDEGSAAGYANGIASQRGFDVATRREVDITAAHTSDAAQWQGWGTALKPAFEPIVVARKPLVGTVAANVQAHGTGALNIDGTRVQADDAPEGRLRHGGGSAVSASMAGPLNPDVRPASPAGRWPANVLLDGDAAAELDEQSGTLKSGKMMPTHTTAGVDGRGTYGADAAGGFTTMETYGDSGGASRFFPTFRYQAKAPTRERPTVVAEDGTKTAHPTVKPLELMRWLVRLVTPPGGLVLDPFAGSGTTAEACRLEGVQCIAVEQEAEYLPLITARLARHDVASDAPAAESETAA